jgi:coenzyme F420-reducing hydrogenase delta subunit
MKRLFEFIGFEPGRFHARWISGSEAQKVVETARKVTEEVRALGPNKKMRDDRC